MIRDGWVLSTVGLHQKDVSLWWKFRESVLSRSQFIVAIASLRQQIEFLLEINNDLHKDL